VMSLEMLESWLSGCFTFVKWYDSHPTIFSVRFGVRQGSVLMPYLFSVYIDDVGKLAVLFCYMLMTFANNFVGFSATKPGHSL